MPTVADEPCLTLCTIARLLDCHPSAPLRWIARGSLLSTGERLRLRAVRAPGGWRVRREDLAAFLDTLTADRLRPESRRAGTAPKSTAKSQRVAKMREGLAAASF
jgi:hypothetical protein